MQTTDQAPQTPAEVPAEWRDALAGSALLISAFRWRLRQAGYPFREPAAVDQQIAKIDALLFPDPPRKRGKITVVESSTIDTPAP